MRKPMKKMIKLALTLLLAASVSVPQTMQAAAALSNPVIVPDASMRAGQKVTWDCVYFGSYPQGEVVESKEYREMVRENLRDSSGIIVDAALYNELVNATYDDKNETVINGEKYRRLNRAGAMTYNTKKILRDLRYYWVDSGSSNSTGYHYFKYEPIKWRVLQTDGTKAFLLSDLALDARCLNDSGVACGWDESTLRSYLNGYDATANKTQKDFTNNNFYDDAFSADEKTAIVLTTVKTGVNTKHGVGGCPDTTDYVFLLGEDEFRTEAATKYGFTSDIRNDEGRYCNGSMYARARGCGIGVADGSWHWTTRASGSVASRHLYVNAWGEINMQGCVSGSSYMDFGVRPAINLDLSNTELYAVAEPVQSKLYVNGAGETETPSPSASASAKPAELGKQTIQVKSPGSFKASKLKKKKVSFSLNASASGKGKITYKNITTKKLKKYISVSNTGMVTLKKGAKKGTYKIKISIEKDSAYAAAQKTVSIKVK